MFKAELVCYHPEINGTSFKAGEFRQLSFIGCSDISEEAALEDAYNQAFSKYGLTSDDIKHQKTWTTNLNNRKEGFMWPHENQHKDPKRLTRQQEYAIKKARANDVSSETL